MIDGMRMRRDDRRGGILGGLVIAFLLIACALIMGGLFLAHNIKVRKARGGEVKVDTPFGSLHVQHDSKSRSGAIGMPLYPGAKPVGDGNSATVDLSQIFGDKDLHIVAGKWRTTDPIDKVQKYYEDKFPDMNVIEHTGSVEMHSIDGHAKRVISLRDKGGETEISLASVGEPKAN
jgi:hypothetical protein